MRGKRNKIKFVGKVKYRWHYRTHSGEIKVKNMVMVSFDEKYC